MFRLLIAIDGSEYAGRAIEAAARLAKLVPETEAVLINVRELPVYYGELPAYDFAAIEEASQLNQVKLLDEAVAKARASGLQQVVTEAALGVPATQIARVAAERAVDQIVIGTHGRNALAGLVMGSVAQRVVHLVSMPVLLVK
jgi:nucleotide-binding universal stress UspA family protein